MDKGKEINNVSATTAIDLKTELAQHVEQFEKIRSTQGKQVTAKRPDKKPTVWTRQNKGVNARNEKDAKQQLEAVEYTTLTKSREQLEKKAKIYEAMRSGKYRHDSDEDEDKMPLIDFDRKYMQERELDELRQESEHERKKRKHVKEEEEEDNPWVEYEDEFGRTRIVRRNDLPKRSPPPDQNYSDSEEEGENGITYSMPRKDYEKEGLATRADIDHYDSMQEIRTKGVGFYGFSQDEKERQEQLAKLNQMRNETENARKSFVSAADKRKQVLAKRAEQIRAKKAVLKAKKNHQLKPEEVTNNVQHTPAKVDEESVTNFLQSVRRQLE